MDDLELLIDLHRRNTRQGPGGDRETRLALALSGLNCGSSLTIADIGCGTGASTLILAKECDAKVTAVDLLPEFLTELERRVAAEGLAERVEALAASMEALPFEPGSFDVIWSEGAIYRMGFGAGIRAWRRFLKPNGILAVSELTWLTAERPRELQDYWDREYPEVAAASQKLGLLEASGYTPVGFFPLPATCWLNNYYRPMQQKFEEFLTRHGHSEAARAVVAAEQAEIDLYERYFEYVSYGFYVARKLPDDLGRLRPLSTLCSGS